MRARLVRTHATTERPAADTSEFLFPIPEIRRTEDGTDHSLFPFLPLFRLCDPLDPFPPNSMLRFSSFLSNLAMRTLIKT